MTWPLNIVYEQPKYFVHLEINGLKVSPRYRRLYRDLGQIEAAIDHYNQDLAICREIGDSTGEGSVLGNLGTVYLTLCDYQKAIELFTESVAIAKQFGNIRSAGIFLGNLGNAHQLLEEYELAIDYYTEAIAYSRTIGNRNSMGNLGNLGELFSKLEMWDNAEQHLVEGIELCKTTYPLAAGAFASILAGVRTAITSRQRDGTPI